MAGVWMGHKRRKRRKQRWRSDAAPDFDPTSSPSPSRESTSQSSVRQSTSASPCRNREATSAKPTKSRRPMGSRNIDRSGFFFFKRKHNQCWMHSVFFALFGVFQHPTTTYVSAEVCR
eukprot:TRINITY_DN7556_c0_g1_i8.p1 TRINITY_DN7556_c0_g1~~TRINITY_DN7556_c0_g1_i8.p1  ORF type:complete len:132 (-),score=21.05 TRINITY_DN7556_c0_g1_i8:248-601(-)